MQPSRLHLHLAPWMVAGVQTQFVHLEKALVEAGVDVSVTEVHPWIHGGRVERLPLPSRTRGTIRSLATLYRLSMVPADALWTQVALPLLPYLMTTGWLRQAPVLYAIDCTPKLLFDLGVHYRAVAGDPASPKGRLTAMAFKSFFKRCAGLLPWSHWAARSMIEDYGAEPARVHVVPPGIDTRRWKPSEGAVVRGPRLQLLFVGGDFERKGGTLLLDIYRRHLRDTCDLNVVTRANLKPEPGVKHHSHFGPDDDGLLELYQASDVLVVPTFADCFSMAAIEAMACGLPVITCAVGGIPEIVHDGETGFLAPTGDGRKLLESIRLLAADPELRKRLGRSGREAAVQRFDATAQGRRLIELILGAEQSEAGLLAASSVTQRT